VSTRFRNLDGSGPQPLRAVFKWGVVDSLLGRRRKSPPTALVPQVPLDPARVAQAPGRGEPARLTWLGHASWLVQLDGRSFLIDPVFGHVFPRIPRASAAPLPPDRLPKIDAVLVSHSHYDHLDRPSLRKVNVEVIAGHGMSAAVGDAAPSTRELAWWEETDVGGVSVAFVPAQHWSKRTPFDTNAALWGGFVIQGSSATVYHSGDTAYFDGFAEIGRRYAIDAALLPIGAYDPEWFMRRQHMNPEDAARAFVDLNAREFFAMHWGTFKLTDEPLDEPPARLAAEWERRGLEVARKRVLAVGEIATVARGSAPSGR
jgi:L-ascorbate metabolism protein UlaG (beta-lactamase superfamily)